MRLDRDHQANVTVGRDALPILPPQQTLNFGFTSSAVWVQLRLTNPAPAELVLFLVAASPIVQDVRLFRMGADGRATLLQAGSQSEFAARYVQQPEVVFPITLGANTTTEFVLRAASELRMELPLRLYRPETYLEERARSNLIVGLYLGVLGVAACYNLFLFVSIRDRSYLYYVAYVLTMACAFVASEGVGHMYLWPRGTWWNAHVLTLVSGWNAAAACVFTVAFLELRGRRSRTARFLYGYASLILVASALVLWLPGPTIAPVVNVLLALLTVVLFAVGVHSLRGGYRPARYFLLAFALVFAAILIFLLQARGLVQGGEWALRLLQGASATEVVLLSLGLGDRINTLRARATLLEREAIVRTAQLKEIEIELQTARRIQMAILPRRTPKLEGIHVAARYQPMLEVGGDFYDFYAISGSVLGVIIADVSGHGVPAALIASMLKVACAEQIGVAGRPDVFLSTVNRTLLGKQSDEFVTAGFAVLDRSRGLLQYANAGHPPLLHLTASGELTRLRPAGRILGVFPDPSFTSQQIAVSSGDRLVFYTDGVVEATAPSGQPFGMDRLEASLHAAGGRTPDELCDGLLLQLRDWTKRKDQDDDITLIVVDVQ